MWDKHPTTPPALFPLPVGPFVLEAVLVKYGASFDMRHSRSTGPHESFTRPCLHATSTHNATSSYIYIYVSKSLYIYKQKSKYTNIHMYIHICVYVDMYKYIYIYIIYIYIYFFFEEREREIKKRERESFGPRRCPSLLMQASGLLCAAIEQKPFACARGSWGSLGNHVFLRLRGSRTSRGLGHFCAQLRAEGV